MTTEPSDLAGLAAFHAAEWLDTGADTVVHRPALAGCSCGQHPEPLTLAYCLAQAAHWQRLAARIGAATVEAEADDWEIV